MTTDQLVERIVELADSKKAENILTLNISKKSSLAEYFIICEGSSERQVKAIADEIIDRLKEEKIRPFRVDGRDEKKWIVIDYNSIIVHVFHPEYRQTYKLEELWGRRK
ncbi:MAG TPA: ribosome silencing factor [bacterium]|nr:ribosome silencing factor [bacterium]